MRKHKLDMQQDYKDPNSLQKALLQLLEQVSRRDQKIAWINAENTAALRAFEEKEQAMLQVFAEKERSMLTEIAEKDAILFYKQAQLKERESQINEIITSKTWKVALLFQRVRVFLVPLNSRRARALQRVWDFILFPFRLRNRIK